MRWLVFIGCFLSACLHARAEWQIFNSDGRDYVSLRSIAEFYGMSPPAPAGGKRLAAAGGGRSIQVEMDSREVLINGTRHWFAFPARAVEGGVAVAKIDLLRTIDPVYRPEKVANVRPFKTVVLDAGHGGHDNGAASPFGYEKEFTLDIVRRLRKRLEAAGLRVAVTRNSDVFIDLERRPVAANKLRNALFVSIHFNSADWKPSANGLETYCISPLGVPPSGQDQVMARDRMPEKGHALEPVNFLLANTVHNALVGKLAIEDRGVKRARFVVLKEATTPAILIEGGFLTNPAEAARIANPAWRESYAAAIAAGIVEYKKFVEQGTRPRSKGQW